MIARCNYPSNRDYKWYGGRGIKVCEAWLSYEQFLADMGERPVDMTLDRIDTDGDYCVNNCRWADNVTQRRNSTHCRVSQEMAEAIKVLASTGRVSQGVIASLFGVSLTTVSLVVTNKIKGLQAA
jgi:hypothetical protein